jgi:hypothetical protein
MLRFSTAIFAVLMVIVLGIGAMAGLHKDSDPPSITPNDATVATDSPSDEAEATDPAPVASPKKVNGLHRRRHRYVQPPPEMFEIGEQPLFGRPRARLVTVIQ